MNWFDLVLLAMVGVSVFVGWKVGFLGAGFNVLGGIAGVMLAGRLSDDVADLLNDLVISSEPLALVAAYVLIFLAIFVAAQVARAIVKRILSGVFLGWVERVGGLALGLAGGVVFAVALVAVLARLAVDLPGAELARAPLEKVHVREGVDNALTHSRIVALVLDLREAAPADLLGLVPEGYKVALDLLERRMQVPAAGTAS